MSSKCCKYHLTASDLWQLEVTIKYKKKKKKSESLQHAFKMHEPAITELELLIQFIYLCSYRFNDFL